MYLLTQTLNITCVVVVVVVVRSKELKTSTFTLMLILSFSLSLSHSITCCCDEIKGTQGQDFSCSFSDSLSLDHWAVSESLSHSQSQHASTPYVYL